MREIDKTAVESGIPALLLMENAGRTLADECHKACKDKGLIVVLAGPGQNGGDGFVAARHLCSMGHPVKVAFFGDVERLPHEASVNFHALSAYPIQVFSTKVEGVEAVLAAMENPEVVVDCLLGTGLAGNPRPPIETAIRWVNDCQTFVVACDVPSGLSSDSGMPYDPTVKANVTVTMGLPKIGLFTYPGRKYSGKIIVESLGLPPSLLEVPSSQRAAFIEDARKVMPRRLQEYHKGQCGHVTVIAGSKGMAGAAVLSAKSALRAGAGTVTLVCPGEIYEVCASMAPEVMVVPYGTGPTFVDESCQVDELMRLIQRSSAVVLGPGFGRGDSQVKFLSKIIPSIGTIPTVIDADGLNNLVSLGGLSYLGDLKGNFILTPHLGEMARLLGKTVQQIDDRVFTANNAAKLGKCVVCLKGAGTVVANHSGEVVINTTGGPAMATAGSGDVLTGIIAGLVGQGLSHFDSAWLGVFWHGLAGDLAFKKLGSYGILAGDIAEALPRARGVIEGRCEP
jgi:hydroxyethylthiazole kinase-like uncharacterized protein yjeF